MAASNTIECIEELIDEKMVGVIETWPTNTDITSAKALVFESGFALVLCDNGSYWQAHKDEVDRVLDRLIQQYDRSKKITERLLALAGRTPAGQRAEGGGE